MPITRLLTLLGIMACLTFPQPLRAQEARNPERPLLALTLPGMADVTVTQDLDYARSGNPDVVMDIYHPENRRGENLRPAVIFVHGGGLNSTPSQQVKNLRSYRGWGRLAAVSGWVGVTFNHRLGRGLTAMAASDVAAAIAYVRSNAATLGVDADRLCVVAFSGGGRLLADYIGGAAPEIRCVIGFYPFMDVRAVPEYVASETPGILERYAPLTRLDDAGRKPPLLLFRAGADEIPSLNDALDAFVEAALANDHPLTLVNVPEAPHGFDYADARPVSVEAIRTALAFLKAHLESPSQPAP